MGAEADVEILRPGYPPRGQGHLRVNARPLKSRLSPLDLSEQGRIKDIRGISLASHLENEKVGERMAGECERLLKPRGYPVQMEILNDRTALQKGAALLLWAETDTGCLLGS